MDGAGRLGSGRADLHVGCISKPHSYIGGHHVQVRSYH
jgi:hypothetical protein